jgi:hypothetical protein
MKIKSVWRIMVSTVFMAILLAYNTTAADLIVVATKATQDASKEWLGFLESKEIPVKVVTPDSFSGVKDALYIIVIGSIDESKEIADIAKDALPLTSSSLYQRPGRCFINPRHGMLDRRSY